jgi:hypothetical protein
MIVFVFLWRHRHELDKPVVRFRYGLFFAGFREKRFYWECVVALRKESTVILAVFGPQMGVAMLAHVALLVFMIQIFIQLVGTPYEADKLKLQVLDVASILVCWITMWSGFFFYTPRPPSQKNALEALTVMIFGLNVLYMLVLLYEMCSETISENSENSFVLSITSRTTELGNKVKKVKNKSMDIFSSIRPEQKVTEHFVNPALSKEIQMTTINISSTPEGTDSESVDANGNPGIQQSSTP